jgi:hypothetical protein
MITKCRLCLRVLRLAALDGEFAKLHASAALREGSSPPGLRLPKAKLSRKSNQVARGRIRQFESYMPSQAVQSLWGVSDAEKYARHSGASGYVTTRSP